MLTGCFSHLGGFLADKYGRKTVIVVFGFVVVIGQLIFFLSPNWVLIIPGIILASFSGVYMSALTAIIGESLPRERRATGFSIYHFFPSLAWIIGPPLGGFLIKLYGTYEGIRWALLATFLSGLAACTLRAKFLRETYLRAKTKVNSSIKGKITSFIRVLKEVHLNVKLLLIVTCLAHLGTGLVTYYYVIYITEITKITLLNMGY